MAGTILLSKLGYLKRAKSKTQTEALELEILRVHHRWITDIIESIFQDDIARTYNMLSYHKLWKSPDVCHIKIFSEAYFNVEMMETYQEINDLPHEAGDNLKFASLVFWSNTIYLANIGNTSLWLFYLYFSNQLKYTIGNLTVHIMPSIKLNSIMKETQATLIDMK